jgi:glycerophosphoryl diester phosphodiesterase
VSRLALLALGVGILASLAGPPRSGASVAKFAAHRGGALLWPENSLLAFARAAELGADYLEFDVHLSSDGEPVVIHDATLERTTTGAGAVRATALDGLGALRLKDRAGTPTDERVPTLDEVLALAARTRRQVLLEIKVDDRRQRYSGIEEKALAALDRHGMTSSTVVMAFEGETWRRVRALRPTLRAGALYSPRTLEQTGTTLAAEMEEAHRAGVAFLGLHQGLVNADTVAAAGRAGFTLGVWTVNDAEALRRFIGLGVGVLITDRPDLARDLLGR